MIKGILIALICTLISCSGVEYPEKLTSNIAFENASNIDLNWKAEPDYNSCIISFNPIPGATSYTLNSENIVLDVIPSRDYKDGRLTREMKSLESNKEYTVFLSAFSGGDKKDLDTKLTFKTKDIRENPPKYPPVAYLEKRNSNSAEVSFILEADMHYKAWWVDKNVTPIKVTTKEGSVSETKTETIQITGLNPNYEYEIHILHGYKENEWGEESAKVTIPKFDGVDASVNFTLKEDGSFTITNYSEGNQIYLIDKNLEYFFTVGSEGKLSFDKLPPLTRLEFYAISLNGDTVTAYSNRQSILTPIKVEEKISQNEIVLFWPEEKDTIYDTSLTFTPIEGRNYPSVVVNDVSSSDGVSKLVISNLVSNTSYDISIKAKTLDGSVSTWSKTIKTPSYEGIYRYTSGVPGVRDIFEVEVKSRASGKYPYEILITENDSGYDGTNHRIAPLVEDEISSFISFNDTSQDYMKAYIWNNKKWNTTTLSPTSWKPDSEKIIGDYMESQVISKANGMSLTTQTIFEFKVVDNNSVLVFSNKGIGKNSVFVNLGLFKNPLAISKDDQYIYVLERRVK